MTGFGPTESPPMLRKVHAEPSGPLASSADGSLTIVSLEEWSDCWIVRYRLALPEIDLYRTRLRVDGTRGYSASRSGGLGGDAWTIRATIYSPALERFPVTLTLEIDGRDVTAVEIEAA